MLACPCRLGSDYIGGTSLAIFFNIISRHLKLCLAFY